MFCTLLAKPLTLSLISAPEALDSGILSSLSTILLLDTDVWHFDRVESLTLHHVASCVLAHVLDDIPLSGILPLCGYTPTNHELALQRFQGMMMVRPRVHKVDDCANADSQDGEYEEDGEEFHCGR